MSINYSNDVTNPISQMNDYRHAARIFTDGNYRLSPKYGFLFYVEFDFNPLITNISNLSAAEMGMVVKSVNLPQYTIDTKIHNAYNRVNIVQNKIKYEPVTIVFHDDQSDVVRSFWYDYYSYYYRDSDYADSTYSAPNKYQSRPTFDWGYTPRPAIGYNNSSMAQPYQYIQGIRIYSLYQQQFSEYQLVNPTITSFKHGEHANGDSTSLLNHEMSVQFETVKYLSGSVTPNTVGGFIDLHYDSTPSPLAPGNFVPGTNVSQQPTNLSSQYIPTNNGSTTQNPATSTNGPGVGFPVVYNAATLAASQVKPNSGGFNVPSFGSLGSITQGIPTSAQIGNQLKAAGVNIVSNATNALTNGVVKGVTSALGKNGSAIVGLAAQAISNPSAVLKTAEGMAINYATAAVGNFVNQQVSAAASQLSTTVGNFASSELSSLNQSAGAAVFGDGSTLSQGLSTEFQQLQTNVTDFFTGSGDIASTIGDF
jgi:hypothetical protein